MYSEFHSPPATGSGEAKVYPHQRRFRARGGRRRQSAVHLKVVRRDLAFRDDVPRRAGHLQEGNRRGLRLLQCEARPRGGAGLIVISNDAMGQFQIVIFTEYRISG